MREGEGYLGEAAAFGELASERRDVAAGCPALQPRTPCLPPLVPAGPQRSVLLNGEPALPPTYRGICGKAREESTSLQVGQLTTAILRKQDLSDP